MQLSAHDQAMLVAKSRLANEFEGMLHGKVSAAQFHRDLVAYAMSLPEPARTYALSRASARTPNCIIGPGGGCLFSSEYLSLTQQWQTQPYYCGPATASEILATLGSNYSQSYLGGSSSSPTLLETNYLQETPWSDLNGNPVMAPTLNKLQSPLVYWTQNGGSVSASQWQSDLLTDIYEWRQPIAGNTVEYGGSNNPYLIGHNRAPASDFPLYHWIAIYGYTNYGSNTAYADSISGNANNWGWGWAAYVPQYSTISSSTMYTLLSTMGWVW